MSNYGGRPLPKNFFWYIGGFVVLILIASSYGGTLGGGSKSTVAPGGTS